jgi:tripartite ATP-independent transporter DctP family solute receptor
MKHRFSVIARASVAAIAAGMFATAATAAPVVLKFASEEPFGNPPRVAAQYGLEYVEKTLPKVTGDAVQAKLYSNATLGSEKELLKSVASGVIDAAVASPGNAAGLIPELQLFSASYLFTSYDHAKKVLADDKFFARLQQIVRDRKLGFQLAGVSLTGTRNLYNRVKPVNALEGLAGMKMRVMNSPTEFKVWSTLGMLPSTIPAPEIYSALQAGVVDAAESSIPAIVGSKYYEVAPHITLTNHQFNLHIYIIGDRALAKIPETARQAVFKAFREGGLVQVDAAVKLSDEKLQFLKSQPNVTVTPVDTAPFAKKLKSIQDDVAAELKVQDLLQMIRAAGTGA